MAPHSKVASPRTTPADVPISTPFRASSPPATASNPFRKGSKIPLPSLATNSASKPNGQQQKHPSPTPNLSTPSDPRPQPAPAQQSINKSSHNDLQARSKVPAPLSTKRSNLPRTQKDKPLPSTPALNVIGSSPARNSRTLLDATEHPPLRRSPGTPEEQDWPSLSPEKAKLGDKQESHKHAVIGTSEKATQSDAIHGRKEALAALSTPATPSRTIGDRSKSSTTVANRATVATFHKATLVDRNSPHLGSRRSVHIPSPTKSPNTPSKHRRLSDPGSPPSATKTAGDRIVQMSYGQTLTINEEADRVIFGGPPRKPTFTELRSLKQKQTHGPRGLGTDLSGFPTRAESKDEVFGMQQAKTDVEAAADDDDAAVFSHGSRPQPVDTTAKGFDGQLTAGDVEESGRGRSIDTRSPKGSGHQRSPTPHSNMMFGRHVNSGRRVPLKEDVAPWTSSEGASVPQSSTSKTTDAAAAHPPRSDSLRDVWATTTHTQLSPALMPKVDNSNKVDASIVDRKLPHSVAESSFEAFLTKAKSAKVGRASSVMSPSSQKLPEKAAPNPATITMSQAAPVEAGTASSSFDNQDSTFPGRISRRETDTTTTGSQVTGNESHRSRSRGRRVISNLKEMFHRRAAESKDDVPPIPARSFSRKHISPLHITKKQAAASSPGATKLPCPSPRSLTTPNLTVPQSIASVSSHRDVSSAMNGTTATPTHKPTEVQVTASTSKDILTAPKSPAKANKAKAKKEDPLFRLTSQAYELMDHVKTEPDHTKKGSLLATAQLAMDCVANARETEKAMHKAQQAAKEAEISYQLVKAGVGEVGRMISGMTSEKGTL